MFKTDRDHVDKYQPIRMRDWPQGEVHDPDTQDVDASVLLTCRNVRYVPGKLESISSDSNTICSGFASATAYLGAFYHQTERNSGGSLSVTDWIYVHDDTNNALKRMYYSGGWSASSVITSHDMAGNTPVYSVFGERLDMAGSLTLRPVHNWYQIAMARFNDDATYGVSAGWYATKHGMQAPTLLVYNQYNLGSDPGINTSGNYNANTVGLHINDGTVDGGAYVFEDVIDIGISFERDGCQESALSIFPGVTIKTTGDSPTYTVFVHGGLLDERVTAINVYRRRNSGNFYLFYKYDINDGAVHYLGTSLTWADNGFAGRQRIGETTLGEDKWNSYTTIYTYSQQTGWSEDTETTDPYYKLATQFGNRRIIANVSHNGTTYYNRLYISPAGKVNTFPDENYIDILEDNSEPFTALAVWNRILFAFKGTQLFIIDVRPSHPSSWRVVDRREYGAFNQNSVTMGTNGVYFANSLGIFYYNGQDFQNITEGKIEKDYLANVGSGSGVCIAWDSEHDEIVVDYTKSTIFMVYDKYGRWSSESWSGHARTNMITDPDGAVGWFDLNYLADVYWAVRQAGASWKAITIATHDQDFGSETSKILRKFRIRTTKTGTSSTITVKHSTDNAAYSVLTTGLGTPRGTGIYILDWEGKHRFKTISIQIEYGSYQIYIEELTLWILPRKGVAQNA